MLDPHDGSRFITCYVLSLRGHVCHPVVSELAAITAIETFKPDVVIYEWFRIADGAGLGARLRARMAKYALAPLVIVASTDEPQGLCDDEHIDAYLIKPIRPADLEALLEGHVRDQV